MSIKEDLVEFLQSGETDSEKLGLEIEHFVVDKNGTQIGFDEVTELIGEKVAANGYIPFVTDEHIVGYDTGEYTVTLEPACQFEVSIYPHNSLAQIRSIYEKFYDEWKPIFANRGYSIITAGNLPAIELGQISIDDIPLSPKLRYKYMNQYFETTGKYGKYMMRASGSAQISIDYKSEEDLIIKLRLLEKISPILMIMMENKAGEVSHLPGVEDKIHLLRTQEWEDLDAARTGYFPRSFDEDFGYESIADVILNTPLILLNDKDVTTYVADKTILDLINENIVDYEEKDKVGKKKLIEHVISMGFFHYRIKKYIEIRVADAVEIEKALGYTALIKALFYHEDILSKLKETFNHVISVRDIKAATQEVEKYGFDAIIYGRPVLEWINVLLEFAESVLGKDEKKYLNEFR